MFNAKDSTSTHHKFLANVLSSTTTVKMLNGSSVTVKFTFTDSLMSFLYELQKYEKQGLFLIPSFLTEAIICVSFVRNKLQHESGINKYNDLLCLPFVNQFTWDAIDGFPEDLKEWTFLPQLLLEDWIGGDYKVIDTPTECPLVSK